MKKITAKILALIMSGLSVFALAACNDVDGGNTGGNGSGTNGTEQSGSTGGNQQGGNQSGNEQGGNQQGGNQGGQQQIPPDGEVNGEYNPPAPPTIENKPVAEAVQITKAEGHLESAYAEWTPLSNASFYSVYYKGATGGYVKLDEQLIRRYPDYYRADAVGLKAGTYSLKVVPIDGSGQEQESFCAEATNITVSAHERTGFAFSGGTASGAYNEDGTLKTGAKVVYVTDETKDTVTVSLNTGKKEEEFSGLQNILNNVKRTSTPIAIRLIGQINSPAIDGDNNKDPNTVLIKETNKAGSTVTFEGIGFDATAFGWTLRLVSAENVEVRNLGFMKTQASEPDGVTLEKDNYVWVHNCDFFYGGAGGASDQAKGDGALDTKLSSHITHSYNHFWDSGKCNLQGMKKESPDYLITYHHNWYDHSDSRHPRVRTCTTHIYNNYFDGNAKYGVGITTGASAFVENNYFRSTGTMKPMLVAAQGTDAKGEGTFSGESGGIIKAYGNYFDGKYSLVTQKDTTDKSGIDCYLASARYETVPAEYKAKQGEKNPEGAGVSYNNFDTASDFYKYTPDTPEVAKQKVMSFAGRIGGGDLKYVFNDATDDISYAVITELKNKTVNYKTTLVKAGR